MKIDRKDAERIAKDLIREIASEWADTLVSRCVEENGSYVFEFTLEPGEIIRYARTVERPIARSVFRFNPLAEATELVVDCADTLDQRAPTAPEVVIRSNAKSRIHQMLVSAPKVFTDAMEQARIVGETLVAVTAMQFFGRPDITRGLIDSAVAVIHKKVRDRFGKTPQKQKPKITPVSILQALSEFLTRFKETGQCPSQRQFAIRLGVTPKGWRNYLDRHHLGEHESFVKQQFERLLSLEKNLLS
jgi:hypothetical protein